MSAWAQAPDPARWTPVGPATAPDGSTVTVHEDLTVVDGSWGLLGADGSWTELPRRLERVTADPDEASGWFGGLGAEEVLAAPHDLLGRALLAGDGDPDPLTVAGMLAPIDLMDTPSFLGSPFHPDKIAVEFDGRTATVDAAQFLPRVPEARAAGRVLAGVVDGWLPALRFVYPDEGPRPTSWCEVVMFAPVHQTGGNARVQQVWYRLSRVEQGRRVWSTCLDTYPPVPGRGSAAETDLLTAFLAFRADWRALLAPARELVLPDPRLRDLTLHSLARALATRVDGWPRYGVVDRNYGGPEHDGFQDTFTVELAAATDWGLVAHARTVLDNYLDHFVRDDGTLEYRGPGTGQYGRMLTAVAQLHRCTGDDEALLRHRRRLDAVAGILLDLRTESLLLPHGDPGRGLLAGWCEADSSLEADPARYRLPYLSSTAEAVRGVEDLGRVWADIGQRTGDAGLVAWGARLREQSAGMLADLRATVAGSVRRDLDPPWLPVVAGADVPFHEAVRADGLDPQFRAYRANAELLHSGCLTADEVDVVVGYREAHEDVFLGVPCAYGLSPDPGLADNRELAGFLAHGHFHGLLQHDRVREFLLGLHALAAHQYTRGTWTAPETRRVRPGTPAAPYCSPAQLAVPAMVRWMHVFEQPAADELWLLRATPRDWLAHGRTIEVPAVPTRFGPVGLRVVSALSRGLVEATVDLPAGAPRATWLRLRLPMGQRAVSVEVDGEPARWDQALEAVRLGTAGGRRHVVVTTAPLTG